MQKLRWLAILMGATILGITGFQGYWLKNNYDQEKQNIEITSSAGFRQTILELQSSKLRLDKVTLSMDTLMGAPAPAKSRIILPPKKRKRIFESDSGQKKETQITVMNLIQEKMKDTATRKSFIISSRDGFVQKFYGSDSLKIVDPQELQDRVKSIAITTNDSMAGPEWVERIRKEKENQPRGISIRYKGKPANDQKPDSITINTSAGVFVGGGSVPHGVSDRVFEQRIERDGKMHEGVVRFLYSVDSLSSKDTITIKEITEAYSARLKEDKIDNLAFSVNRLDSTHANSEDPTEVTIGFSKPLVYGLTVENKVGYILRKLTLPILFSVFLVGITVVSFVLLYRNLVRQRRLAELKNEFISNITHELKTPIATVGVAIEALKNFNAIHDPQRTQEYLEISQNELQRLSLLVDKVLKLSMFEKKEIELKKEQFDCKLLVEEVMTSMKLQFEKYHAKVKLHAEGENFYVNADKLHITSVIYNLLDNALKYSKEDPTIDVHLAASPESLELSVSDNGIGIETAYKEKIFDKFFRVPTGNKHNIKGYGLGLSYVAEIVKRHQGQVYAESELGKGSTFTAKFPHST